MCFPNLKGQEAKTLYFIGNGFDRYHHLQTCFKHFCCWLTLKGGDYEQFVNEMEHLFPFSDMHGNLLWKDFEDTLGRYDINHIHNLLSGNAESDCDDTYQKQAAEKIHNTFSKIPVYLKKWIESIELSSVSEKLPLSKASRYLTFNYTLLLENVYHIPAHQICHIHNSIKDNAPLITGHKNYFSMSGISLPDYNEEKSWENIANEVNSLEKPTSRIIKQHQDFFDSLKEITHVIVFGHSLSIVDLPYFTETIHHVSDDTSWHFFVYDNQTQEHYQELIQHYNNRANTWINEDKYRRKMMLDNCNFFNITD